MGRKKKEEIIEEEYEEIYDDDEDDEYDIFGVPIGCSACGGDYPYCKDGCPIFDD